MSDAAPSPSPHANSFVIGPAVINTHSDSKGVFVPFERERERERESFIRNYP
jgi:hypothetical protein